MRTTLFTSCIVLLFANCAPPKKCPEKVYCDDYYNFVTVGYDSLELDTVILKKFVADGSFSQMVDSGYLYNTMAGAYLNSKTGKMDTVYMWNRQKSSDTCICQAPFKDQSQPCSSAVIRDWEIYLPSQKRTYRISGITYVGDSSKILNTCDDKGYLISTGCSQYMGSYVINGVKYDFPNQSNLGSIYLVK